MQVDTATFFLKAFDRYTEDLLTTFSRFDKRTFNLSPGEGRWSPGQMMQHLRKAERGTLRLMQGPVVVVEGRPAMSMEEKLSDLVHTRQRLEAPERLRPTEEVYAPMEMLEEIADQRADIRVSFEFAPNIAAEVQAWEHPRVGIMTICEWLYFTAVHGERHRRQYVDFAV